MPILTTATAYFCPMTNSKQLWSGPEPWWCSATLFMALLAALMPSFSGCGRPAGYPETVPVGGRVTLDGEPLDGAVVSFIPVTGGRSSAGITDSSGRYELFYTWKYKGAVVGPQRVTISKQVPDEQHLLTADERASQKDGHYTRPFIETLPERYSGAKSELTAEVKDADNTFNFELTSDGKQE